MPTATSGWRSGAAESSAGTHPPVSSNASSACPCRRSQASRSAERTWGPVHHERARRTNHRTTRPGATRRSLLRLQAGSQRDTLTHLRRLDAPDEATDQPTVRDPRWSHFVSNHGDHRRHPLMCRSTDQAMLTSPDRHRPLGTELSRRRSRVRVPSLPSLFKPFLGRRRPERVPGPSLRSEFVRFHWPVERGGLPAGVSAQLHRLLVRFATTAGRCAVRSSDREARPA